MDGLQAVLVFVAVVLYFPALNTLAAAFAPEWSPRVLAVFGCGELALMPSFHISFPFPPIR